MKLMIASDIHGSAYYCQKLLNRFNDEKADKLLLLGDLLYHGPRNDLPRDYDPKAVTQMLNAHKSELLCVRGNCDSEVDQMVLEFPIMADYCILYLGERMLFATHGHIHNPENPPMLKKGDILLNGHTHVPANITYENFTYLNPGSASMPKEDSKPGYLIITNDTIQWKSLE